MDENNNKSIINEYQTKMINKMTNKLSLFNLKKIQNNIIQNSQNTNNDEKNTNNNEKQNNLEKNIPLLKLLSNKTESIGQEDSKLKNDIPKKGETYSFTVRNKLYPIKNAKFNFSINSKKNCHLTSSIQKFLNKNKIKKCNSTKDFKVNNMLDLIHNKEIKICLDLIKSLPKNSRNNKKILDNINDLKNEETNNLIKSIKFFNIDNINNQRIIENEILNNKNNCNSNTNTNTIYNTLSLSLPINYNSNNMHLNSIYTFKNNKKLDQIFDYSSKSIKNNFNKAKTINENNNIKYDLNNSSSLNEDLVKSRLKNSTNDKIINITNNNNSKIRYGKKNEINFRTGFVRSQKNIFSNVYNKYLKNKSKKEIKIGGSIKNKDLKNKLALPEIEEFKTIIKDYENLKNKSLNNKNIETNIDKNDLISKDNLINELNEIYLNQKNIFLKDLKKNMRNRQYFAETYKKEVNENIQNINKINRSPNIYSDGYSLLDGTINKKLVQYNYILGNKFYDRKQKLEKEKQFYEISDEYENKIKNNENELFKETNLYYQSFIPKFIFNSDRKKDLMNDAKIIINLAKKNISNKYSSNASIESGKTLKIYNSKNSKNLSDLSNKEDKIYNDYINFKKEYKKKYSFD